MESHRNRDVHGAGDGISREIIGVNANGRRTARTRPRNIELSTQQHGARRAAQHIRGAGIDSVRDPISKRIREKRRCQGDSSIFTPRARGVVDVLHMVGIAVSVTIGSQDLGEISGVSVHVAV